VTAELIFVIGVALLFDFTNGFHDAANSIATSVSTRSISPRLAVLGAGLLNFIGAFLSLKVANTIAKGIVDPTAITLQTILAGLVGAIAWNLFTWWRGIPTSSSHALIGGVAGAAIAASGFGVVQWNGILEKVIKPSIYVPILGFALAAVLALALSGFVGRFLDRHPGPLRAAQLVSSGFVALTHGTNDAQKTMGVIGLALVVTGNLSAKSDPPTWVIVLSAAAIALGTYAGGWKIVHTLGRRISNLDLRAGVAAQSSAAVWLYYAANLGFPVSTTQVITGSVLGSGSKERWRTTRWSTAGQIVIAWVITLPCAALAGAGLALVERLPGGQALVFGLVIAVLAGLVLRRRVLFAGWDEFVAAEDPVVDAERLVEPVADEKPRRPKALA
jgi:inorganic phosphate transporter, PiT family